MHLPYMPDDPHSFEMMDYVRRKAVESGLSNQRLMSGVATLSLDGNSVAQTSVTFMDETGRNAKPYMRGTQPFVGVSLSSSLVHGAHTQVSAPRSSITNNGFVIQADSAVPQTIQVSWYALGQTE